MLAILAAAVVAAVPSNAVGDSVTHHYTPTYQVFPNPERGFYRWIGRGALDDLNANYAQVRAGGDSLAYTRLDLSAYRSTPIPPTVLANYEAGFQRLRDAGVKGILRIVYANDAGEPDAPLARLQQHLAQLKPLFAENADVIAFIQAGVIGAWGEWHSTYNYQEPGQPYTLYNLPSPENRRAVMTSLLDAFPSPLTVHLRRPWWKDPDYGEDALFPGEQVTEATAFTGIPVSRVGHHNDCFLSNETDMGTYEPGDPSGQRAFLREDTQFVPLGGETCVVHAVYSRCDYAANQMQSLRYTYLNRDYNRDVLAVWQNEGCFDEVEQRLGYRFELVSAELPTVIRSGQPFDWEITVRNVGFAPASNPRPVYLRIFTAEGTAADLPLEGVDPRRWLPSDPITFSGSSTVEFPSLPASAGLALWFPDPSEGLRDRPEYAIRLANEAVWNDSAGTNTLAVGIPVEDGISSASAHDLLE